MEKTGKRTRLNRWVRRTCAATSAGGLLLMAMPSPAPAQTGSVYGIELGMFPEGVKAEILRMFPSSLRVHPGDILHFTNELGTLPETGVHLTALLPADTAPDEWFAQQGRVPDGPWAWLTRDPDEETKRGPYALKGNNRNIFPSDQQCGETQSNPCPFDGSGDAVDGVVSSGIGWGLESDLDFWVEVTAPAGTTLWAVCPFHPTLRTRIDVIAPGEAASDPVVLEQRQKTDVERATLQAKALHDRLKDRAVSRRLPNGTKRWNAWVGPEVEDIFLVGMYPRKLVIGEGDTVRWNREGLRTEGHTVSFPLGDALDIHNVWYEMKCDLDGDSGDQPDSDAAPLPPFCPGASLQLEQDIHHSFAFPSGNGAYWGARDFETSGLIGPWAGIPNAPMTLRFPYRSPAGGYTYACMLHPTMRGKVIVKTPLQ